MIAFDTDVLSLAFSGDQRIAERIRQIPTAEQLIPIVVVEEILRGRMSQIRRVCWLEIRESERTSTHLWRDLLPAFGSRWSPISSVLNTYRSGRARKSLTAGSQPVSTRVRSLKCLMSL